MRLLQRVADQRRLLVGREGDVEDLDLGVLDQRAPASRGPRPMPQRLATSAALAGVREAIATTGKPASRVGRQMHVRHDEAGADAADLEVAAADRRVRREAHRFDHGWPPLLVPP